MTLECHQPVGDTLLLMPKPTRYFAHWLTTLTLLLLFQIMVRVFAPNVPAPKKKDLTSTLRAAWCAFAGKSFRW